MTRRARRRTIGVASGGPPMSATTPATTRSGELAPDRLRRRCDPARFAFETTAELPPTVGLVGQRRAADALAFGIPATGPGFNVYAAGEPGTGRSTAIRNLLAEAARARPTPSDWCYVHNFLDPARPRALRLRPGEGRRLQAALRDVVRAARREIPRAFESEEYIAGREAAMNELGRRREQLLAGLTARAQALGFAVQPTPVGIAVVPLVGGQPVPEEQLIGLT